MRTPIPARLLSRLTHPHHHSSLRTFSQTTTYLRGNSIFPAFQGSQDFKRFTDHSGESIPKIPRNPLNYLDRERRVQLRNKALKKRVIVGSVAIAICVAVQVWIIYTAEKSEEKEKNTATVSTEIAGKFAERLDAAPGVIPAADAQVVVKEKPGQSHVMLDAQGNEMVETGTSSIPHFPKTIRLPSPGESASRTATPTSITPGQGAEDGLEEYTMLGLGIRTVSFLYIQVYVLGLYVLTSDLETLQAAFVKYVNPNGSSLIPSEKETLMEELLGADKSLEIWNQVLRETRCKSAVRIVPTRNTDFNHLRDGWVRGITGRVQELSRKGHVEFEDESFGEAMNEFKAVLSGRGKAPKGSTVVLTRDEVGSLGVIYVPEHKGGDKTKEVAEAHKGGWQTMGRLAEERISRQVWLGYLGGKNVSSEGARSSIVQGVMELVERPLGTVGVQVK